MQNKINVDVDADATTIPASLRILCHSEIWAPNWIGKYMKIHLSIIISSSLASLMSLWLQVFLRIGCCRMSLKNALLFDFSSVVPRGFKGGKGKINKEANMNQAP